MRDIRSDLEERAHIVQEQVRVAYAHFERMAQQLQSERDARVADLKGSLAMIEKLNSIRDWHHGQCGDAG
jgi:hypothetical protein